MASNRNLNNLASAIAGPSAVILIVAIGMTLFGFVMIYSASAPSAVSEGSTPMVYMLDQVKFAAIGLVAGAIAWAVPYNSWRSDVLNYGIWGLGMAAIVATMFMGAGSDEWGAQRWLVLGPISLQPSEFVKIALVLTAAKLMVEWHEGAIGTGRMLALGFVLVIAPALFIYGTQSDLGTTAIIFAGILAVMWLGEIDWRVIVGLGVGAVLFAVASTATTAYRSNRMLFLDPWNDGQGGAGNGYQIIHSYYAFAQGGIFGVGIGNSTEKYLYLPESETDFIFSIIGEECGMVGALLILTAFIVLLACGLTIARHAQDEFGTMVAGALSAMIFFQAALNMGSAVGAFPTTGKPLPFISSGGSSLIATFIMVGLILSVSKGDGGFTLPIPLPSRGRKGDVYEQRRDNLRVIKTADSQFGSSGGGRSGGYSKSHGTGLIGGSFSLSDPPGSSRSSKSSSTGRRGRSSRTRR